MFFAERIKSIKETDYVLEIGPGGTPHPRADVLLEKVFRDRKEASRQRGLTPKLKTDKKMVFYHGGKLPFKDREFDYIICSQVLEHVDDVGEFLQEILRVAPRGYLEYPTIYYDYIYNFKEHKNFIHREDDTIYWLPKKSTALNKLYEVQKFFYKSLVFGHDEIITALKDFMFEGFEWFGSIKSKRVGSLAKVCLNLDRVTFPGRLPT